MGNFPFFRSPYNNYYYRYYPNYNVNHNSVPKNKENIADASTIDNESSSNDSRSKSKKKSNLEQPIFEILGIYIYLDDLIILGLLFFLYTENVHDDILFMTLILLLLS